MSGEVRLLLIIAVSSLVSLPVARGEQAAAQLVQTLGSQQFTNR